MSLTTDKLQTRITVLEDLLEALSLRAPEDALPFLQGHLTGLKFMAGDHGGTAQKHETERSHSSSPPDCPISDYQITQARADRGRKRLTPDENALMRRLIADGMTDGSIARQIGCSATLVYMRRKAAAGAPLEGAPKEGKL